MPRLNINDKKLVNFKARQELDDQAKMEKLKNIEIKKDLILNHDRIDILMELLGYDCEDFHYAMFIGVEKNPVKIENTPGRYQRWSLSLAPRGHGKSTALTISRSILKFLKNPNIRILIASKTDTNAESFLSEIKQRIKRHQFIEVFGDLQGNPWNDGEITIRTRTEQWREGTISTVGLGKALASKHFDMIIADDLVDEENSTTEAQRNKVRTWLFKVLDPTLMPDGQMDVIGTRYHPDDLYGHLIETMFTKRDKKGRVSKKLYQRYPALIKRRKPKKRKNGKKPRERDWYDALWPSMFSVKFLLQKKRNQGSAIFESQMQNDTVAMQGNIFQWDWFRTYKQGDINDIKLKVFQGVDLAIKQDEKADKFAHVTIGVDPETQNIYILDYYNRVTHYTRQKKKILEMFNKYDPIRVGIEGNGYQSALIQDINSNEEFSKIRTRPIFTEKDKVTRAWKLSAYFERGQVFMLENMTELKEHLLKFPGTYKDLFDALDIAVNTAFGGVNQRPEEDEPGLI